MKDLVVGTIVGALFTCGMVGYVDAVAGEVPITFVGEKGSIKQCKEESQKAMSIMYKRQYDGSNANMVNMSMDFMQENDSQGARMVVQAFDTPEGMDDILKGMAVNEFGAKAYGVCKFQQEMKEDK